ncbi:MAG: HAD hydrolase-like protein [Pseudomonadales bacterium]|nr:HAD hydrolase-like protein [Pseudomonadales bacterium]
MLDFKALLFDVGGSVFNWKDAVAPLIRQKAEKYSAAVDVEAFAMKWRVGMFVVLARLHRNEIPHCNMDDMLAIALDDLLAETPALTLDEVDKADLLQGWHQMDVWQEFPEALERLKSKFTVGILSVLSLAILVDSNKYAGVAWDAVISCEFLSKYKQQPESYLEGAALLGLKPSEICFVAVHPSDLLAAKGTGMHTAFVTPKKDSEPEFTGTPAHNPDDFDFNAADYTDLCDKLGC